jgi:putative phosphoesterase
VRGNNDRGAWAAALPERLVLAIGGARLLVVHDVHELESGAAGPARGVDVVISGHSHKPGLERRDGVLWLNPGSAGPRRFELPIAVARLRIRDGRASARIVPLSA